MSQKADYILDLSGGYCLPPQAGAMAILQAVEKKITTEAGLYPIYSDAYGVQISDLLGKDRLFVEVKLKERIRRAALSVEGVEQVVEISTQAEGDSLQVLLRLKINGNLYEIKGVDYHV